MEFEGEELLTKYSEKELAAICNGIGAAWFPAWLRWVITKCFPSFVIPAKIHDIRYEEGGTLGDFIGANEELRRNCQKAIRNKYKVYDPRYLAGRFFADKFANVCQIAGLPAYNLKGE